MTMNEMGQATVAVFGAGKIGEVLLAGLLRSGWPADRLLATTRRPERAAELTAKYGVRVVDNATAANAADVLAVAVKPQDAGALNCFNRGPLTIRSGSYGPGSASDHFYLYATQAISQNVPLIYDPADLYNDEADWPVQTNTGTTVNSVAPNDGGQRRTGSALSNRGGTSMQSATASPSDPAQWMRSPVRGCACCSSNRWRSRTRWWRVISRATSASTGASDSARR